MLRSGSTPTASQSATISRALRRMSPASSYAGRERVQVDDAVDAVVVVLQAHPVAERPEAGGRRGAGRWGACRRRRAPGRRRRASSGCYPPPDPAPGGGPYTRRMATLDARAAAGGAAAAAPGSGGGSSPRSGRWSWPSSVLVVGAGILERHVALGRCRGDPAAVRHQRPAAGLRRPALAAPARPRAPRGRRAQALGLRRAVGLGVDDRDRARHRRRGDHPRIGTAIDPVVERRIDDIEEIGTAPWKIVLTVVAARGARAPRRGAAVPRPAAARARAAAALLAGGGRSARSSFAAAHPTRTSCGRARSRSS